MKILHRFWFSFASPIEFSPLNFGCGVTAYDYKDATALLETLVFAGKQVPGIKSVIEDVEVQLLDESRVRPNMGNVARRGVWFPLGYES